MQGSPLLQLRKFRLGFSGPGGMKEVLQGIDIDVRPGEMVGLVGESGSGKTVTAKYVLGILPPNAAVLDGQAILLGEDLRQIGPDARAAMKSRIAYVPQDPMGALNPSFTIGHQISDYLTWDAAGRRLLPYLRKRRNRSLQSQLHERAAELMDMVKIHDAARVLDSYPMQLSGGMRQRVLLALAMRNKPQFLVADEPTTALDVTVQKRIIELIQELVDEHNLAGLYITHDLGVARWLCNRSYVMYNGNVVEKGSTASILDRPQHEYTQSLVAAIPRLSDHVPPREQVSGKPCLHISNLSKRFHAKTAVNAVSFDILPGETFAIVGESGSGKTTLANMICGLIEPSDGEIIANLDGLSDTKLTNRALYRGKIQMVWQDPASALNPRQTIGEILELPLKLRGMRNARERRARVLDLLAKVSLPANVTSRTPRSLSGGQKQRVCIARALAMEPEILVLDEPTSALDVSVQARILTLLKDLRQTEKLTFILITHDLGVVRAMADRVAVLYHGELVEIGKADDILTNPAVEYTRALLAAVPTLEGDMPAPSS
ncbi:ABC transporter ATP-binding protein [Nitratireductor aquimarinus]|uniref:dipeptide ABC transporter ATP-binding protein n=1 Tax=Nitratireductor aquimarinus TaxID=889300 RepID=UPI001A8F2164|nr:ABC transporter ATP-binding protein [Nitratireductor aquimarinus]MBN8245665.1 ABC transporter ATP-binding protein [Nitratireductor aquimarinus]MBY6134048.1 ABC transporter ATP-binding protein [Nitratireductor aquimarinus]MCA1305144.1 ABC transporter ATP-binding protein [Nitratireductor aquimarinus]